MRLRLVTVLALVLASACSGPPELEGDSGAPPLSALEQPVLLATPAWSPATPMRDQRYGHTLTLLPNGKVLAAGGATGSGALARAELYEPATGTWSATGSMTVSRYNHTATPLPNGKVLIAGGFNGAGSFLESAELYDPATGTFSATGSLAQRRASPTATLLPNGKVLVVGGFNGTMPQASAELYDPSTGTWSATGSLSLGRFFHTATLLPNGKVLVVGGNTPDPTFGAMAELYDPAAGTWSNTGALPQGRVEHVAVLLPTGKVLVTGGSDGTMPLASAFVYDPAAGTWSATGSLATARGFPSATLLPNGKVLVTGGRAPSGPVSSAEVYDPATGTWQGSGGAMSGNRYAPTALLLPTGKVLVTGGNSSAGAPVALSSVDLWDPASGAWTPTGSLAQAVGAFTLTLLPNGKVLAAGGFNSQGFRAEAHLYDPATGTWSATGSLAQARAGHAATLLRDGTVLISGGFGSTRQLASAEVYDPTTGTFSATGSLAQARDSHTATLLANGRVLIAGGDSPSGRLSSAEVYDPATRQWSPTGPLAQRRQLHAAVLLPQGKVLVSGGDDNVSTLTSAELYDPATGTWSSAGSMAQGRQIHTATLLLNGKVLVAAGLNVGGDRRITELYDPATNTWNTTGPLAQARDSHTATLLPSGKVLVAGGFENDFLASAEVYDPATGTWSATGSLAQGRVARAALLPDGRVLMVGGQGPAGPLSSAELYEDTGSLPAWRPAITGLNPSGALTPQGTFTVNGLRFRGISEGSSGISQTAPTDFPLLRLMDLEQQQVVRPVAFQSFSGTQVTATLPNVPLGRYLLLVTVNALTTGQIIQIGDVTPPETTLTATPPASSTQTSATFTFTGEAGASFECRLDAAAFSPCTSPATYSNLAEGQHTFQVRARDAAGNVDPSPASFTWSIDATAPDTTFTSTPPNLGNQSTATFTFTSSEAGATFECQLDTASYAPCTSPTSHSNLAEGQHTFRVRARDAAGNVDSSPASHTWTIDLTSPGARFTSTPPPQTFQTSATFGFDAAEPGASFECSLDGAAFSPCTSPVSHNTLSLGQHTFRVRARDAAGNMDSTPASHTWTISQASGVDTAFTSVPANPSAETSATFTFISNVAGATFECSLDESAFSACTSPTTRTLALGQHTFKVRAKDAGGNVDPTPASHTWTISQPAAIDTTISSAPQSSTLERNATFTFTSNVVGGTFECSLDGAAFSACTSPASYTNLAPGSHTFQVRAKDTAGAVDASPASHTWAISLPVPAAPVILSPTDGATVTDNPPAISGTAEPGTTITLTLDGAVAGTVTTAATGAWSFTPTAALADGAHTVFATATGAGGTSPASATVSFTVTTAKPPGNDDGGGCGCGAGEGDASWMLAGMSLLAALAARRRRFLA
jgi:MYXO-CTERM domain-containing protein